MSNILLWTFYSRSLFASSRLRQLEHHRNRLPDMFSYSDSLETMTVYLLDAMGPFLHPCLLLAAGALILRSLDLSKLPRHRTFRYLISQNTIKSCSYISWLGAPQHPASATALLEDGCAKIAMSQDPRTSMLCLYPTWRLTQS